MKIFVMVFTGVLVFLSENYLGKEKKCRMHGGEGDRRLCEEKG
jgi:hypothetical protein